MLYSGGRLDDNSDQFDMFYIIGNDRSIVLPLSIAIEDAIQIFDGLDRVQHFDFRRTKSEEDCSLSEK